MRTEDQDDQRTQDLKEKMQGIHASYGSDQYHTKKRNENEEKKEKKTG